MLELIDELFNNNERVYGLRADIFENGDDYNILINMPGVKKEDVKISLEDEYLIVESKTKKDENISDKNYIRRERLVGNFARSFYIGKGYKEEDINAKLEDGILSLTFPKVVKCEETKKFINIQ